MRLIYLSGVLLLFLWACQSEEGQEEVFDLNRPEFDHALKNGALANEGFRRSLHFVEGWLQHRDPETGLIPRNLNADSTIWNAKDAAADNYPFMVLTAAMVDSALFNGTMREILTTERNIATRIKSLPDTYSFTKNDFRDAQIDTGQIIFGTSEYMKDGLMPLTEWLGPSPWFDRMKEMSLDLHEIAGVVTDLQGHDLGRAPVEEVNGELLQVLSRLYWATHNELYLDWAIGIADHYLLDGNLPNEYLRTRDHGCEIISGLSEIYFTVANERPDKKEAYQEPYHQFLDMILAQGRNQDGLFYNAIEPRSGQVVDSALADTWGYVLDAYYTVYLVDMKEEYKAAVMKALNNINKYRNYPWEGKSSDGYADAIESALNLYNREQVPGAADWIDSEMQVMWAKQQPSGIIEGWHGDGNFARTTLMYNLWKTKGLTVSDWRDDLVFGAEISRNTEDTLLVSMTAEQDWSGKLIFDKLRHREYLNLPLDYPRINQFPEWYTILEAEEYLVQNGNKIETVIGKELRSGYPVQIAAGDTLKMVVYVK